MEHQPYESLTGLLSRYWKGEKLRRSISALVLFRKTSALRAGLNSGLRLLFLPRIEAGNDNGIERRSLHGVAG